MQNISLSDIGSIASVIALVLGILVVLPPVRKYIFRWRAPTKGQARAAVAIVYNGGSVLMVRRRGTAENLTWQFPAGTINGVEEPALRAIEEVREETGVTCRFDKRLGERHHPDTHVYLYYVACTYVSGDARNRDDEENVEVKWVQASEVEQLVTSDLFAPVASFLRKIQKGHASAR